MRSGIKQISLSEGLQMSSTLVLCSFSENWRLGESGKVEWVLCTWEGACALYLDFPGSTGPAFSRSNEELLRTALWWNILFQPEQREVHQPTPVLPAGVEKGFPLPKKSCLLPLKPGPAFQILFLQKGNCLVSFVCLSLSDTGRDCGLITRADSLASC